jgi:formylglycine-generating enzyme required for sulfatase activity
MSTSIAWPLSQDYNEAVQSPAANFADDDLRRGKVACNALGIPLPCSGNFADVYQVRCPDGARWAVKCFTREVPGLHQRYDAISRHLRQAKLPFTVDFSFLDQGIRVRGRWFPVLKMEWVEGLTLNQFVAQHADKPATLEALLKLWTRMARHLRASGAAHGDLQHGNVLLVPDASGKSLALKLVDYDGMFVPALARSPSGEVGHPSYQHPQRQREGTYSLEVDRFPVLLVAAALAALKVKGRALWERYDNGDNLLFTQDDLEAPHKSRLFYELLKLDDPAARDLAEALAEAARKPLDETPLLAELLGEGRPAPAAPVAESAPSAHAEVAAVVDATARAAGELADADYLAERRRRNAAALWIAGGVGAAVALLGLIVAVIVLAGGRGGDDSGKGQAVARGNGGGASPKGQTQPRDGGAGAPREGQTVLREDRSADSGKGRPPAPGNKPADPKQPERLSKAFKNSLGMEFALVPKGRSWLGGGGGKPGENEVNIPHDFYLGKYLVTQEEWQAVMGSNPSIFSRAGELKDAVKLIADTDLKRFPVENVSWENLQLFLAKLNKRIEEDGWVYRLPTEVEWEYACRGGPLGGKQDSAFDFYFDGPTNELLPGQANFGGDKGLKRSCKVGSYKPNRLGLYDMHGNLHEWCDETTKAADGALFRVYRGGCWGNDSKDCRAAARGVSPTSVDSRSRHIGLRVARVPVDKEDE